MAKNVNVKAVDKNYTFVCSHCKQMFKSDQFYSFPNKAGLLPVCKNCMYEYAIDGDKLSRTGLIDLCRYLDMPFLQNYYADATSKNVSSKWQLSQYFNKLRLNTATHFLYFKDSSFDDLEANTFKDMYEHPEEIVELENETSNTQEEVVKEKKEDKTAKLKELQLKWGKYQDLDFLLRCEELYQEIVQGGYIIRSSMHDISIRHYCTLQVKWNLAQEMDDFAKMDKLKQPLRDARTDAKLNPSQLKPEDFSAGGANSFSEITRLLAQKNGFIPFPMKYYKQPNDALDFLVWEIVNYMRHCIGLPEVEYEEIYEFQIKKIKEFNEKFGADIENGDLGSLDEDTKGNKKTWSLI